MKVNITYVSEFDKSVYQAKQCKVSCEKVGYEIIMNEGIVPATLDADNLKPMPNSRAWDYETENQPYLASKKSCFSNHIRFWEQVVESNETQIFLEHDARAIRPWDNPDFDEYLILNMDAAFRNNRDLWKWHAESYEYNGKGKTVIKENVSSLKYHKENEWKDSYLVPGTAAYAIKPCAAQKLLDIAYNKGWDQSDFFINSANIHIQYSDPQHFEFSGVNLKTSMGFR